MTNTYQILEKERIVAIFDNSSRFDSRLPGPALLKIRSLAKKGGCGKVLNLIDALTGKPYVLKVNFVTDFTGELMFYQEKQVLKALKGLWGVPEIESSGSVNKNSLLHIIENSNFTYEIDVDSDTRTNTEDTPDSTTRIVDRKAVTAIQNSNSNEETTRLSNNKKDIKKELNAFMYEYIEGMDLDDYLSMKLNNRVPLEEVLEIALGVITILEELHEYKKGSPIRLMHSDGQPIWIDDYGITHRDIKPGNIIVTLNPDGRIDCNSDISLTDFGIAGVHDGSGKFIDTYESEVGIFGTPCFIPPEIWRGGKYIHGSTGDIFSLGVTLYKAISGINIYEKKHVVNIAINICKGDYRPLNEIDGLNIPEEFVSLIDDMLKGEDRPNTIVTAQRLADIRKKST